VASFVDSGFIKRPTKGDLTMATLINSKIPDFKVQAFAKGDFKTVTQNDLKGKWTIFFFYPADFTYVCPT
jgi:peroxiredoxin (alkyl hydroperoxide reductase subunit C)